MWGAPDGWMPLKMRGRGAARRALATGAGASSVVIARECSGPPSPLGTSTGPGVGYHSADAVDPPDPAMSGAPLRVAVLGAGTVGHEVACALLERAAELRPSDGGPTLGAGRPSRSATSPGPSIAASRPSSQRRARRTSWPTTTIDVIVELMGGDEPAHTLIAAALVDGQARRHGQQARHRPSRRRSSRRSRAGHGAALRFEAAVGGGIPVLGPLASDLAANRIERVRGIVNGTTNYILTAMTDEDDPQDYATALAEAQRLGYAEADPSGDVEGRRCGQQARDPRPARVRPLAGPGRRSRPRPTAPMARPVPASPTVTPRRPARRPGAGPDHPAAGVGVARSPDGGLAASVLPTALPLDSPLGRTAGVRNRIEIDAVAGRPGRVRRSRRGRRGHVVGRARRPHGRRPRAPARRGARGRRRLGPTGDAVAARRGTFLETASGIRYPLDD